MWGGGFQAKRAAAADKLQQPAPNKKRPIESHYTSHVAYTRALEMYCDTLAQPAQELWLGLTDEEIHGTAGYNETREMYQFALALMAKLKEKNT
jgi:hypothetical protein